MSNSKRGEKSPISSSTEAAIDTKKARAMSNQENPTNFRALSQNLAKENRENFSKRHEEISFFRLDIKKELEEVRRITSEAEKSVRAAWSTIDDMKEDESAAKALHQEETHRLREALGKM